MATLNSELRPQRKKPKFLDPDLSDAQRREVRSHQRSIQEQMLNGELGWEQGRAQNNDIFKNKVAFAREMVIDVENGKIALGGFAKEVEATVQVRQRMQDAIEMIHSQHCRKLQKVPRFDAINLADRLAQKASKASGFDWGSLGSQVGVCFSAVPSGLSFLAGALDAELRQRAKPKKRAKRTDDEPKEKVEETRPEEVTNNKSDGDKLSAMEKLHKRVKTRLGERSKEEQGTHDDGFPKMDAVRFLFNPDSFTQTVENIFTYSFLIKKGAGGIGTDGNSLYVHLADGNGTGKTLPARQSVCSFTMADFRLLTENQKDQDLPHR